MAEINYGIEIDFTSEGDNLTLTNANYGIYNGVLRAATGRQTYNLFDYDTLVGSFAVGDTVKGQTSNAAARILQLLDDVNGTTGTFVYFLLAGTFSIGETIKKTVPDANSFVMLTAQEDAYKNQFLMKNSISAPSKYINLDDSGGYASFSTLKFALDNGDNVDVTKYLWFFLTQNAVVVKNSPVKLFIFNLNQAPYTFELWSGTVDDNPRSETSYLVSCIDNFKKIHKLIPNDFLSKAQFPNLETELEGTFIPSSYGRLYNNKLIPVNASSVLFSPLVLQTDTSGPGANIRTFGDLAPVISMATSYQPSNKQFEGAIIDILVGTISIAEDELVGSFIFANFGKGNSEFRLIIANEVSTDEVRITVSESVISTTRTINDSSGGQETPDIFIWEALGTHNPNVGATGAEDPTYITIVTFKKVFVLSDNRIFSIDNTFSLNERGLHLKTDGKIDQLESLELTTSVTDIDNNGFPGVEIQSGQVTPDNGTTLTRAVNINMLRAQIIGYTTFGQQSPPQFLPVSAQSYPSPGARNTIYDGWHDSSTLEKANLIDRSLSTKFDVDWGLVNAKPSDSYITHVQGVTDQFTKDWNQDQKEVRFACDISIDDFDTIDDLDDVFFGCNFKFRWTNKNVPTADIAEFLRTTIEITAIDIYGNSINSDPITIGDGNLIPVVDLRLEDWIFWDGVGLSSVKETEKEFNFFPREYFNSSTLDDSRFYENKDTLNISDFIKQDSVKDFLKYLRVSIRVQTGSYASRQLDGGGTPAGGEPSDKFGSSKQLRAMGLTSSPQTFKYRDVVRSATDLNVSEIAIEATDIQGRHPIITVDNEDFPLGTGGAKQGFTDTFTIVVSDVDLFNGTNSAIDMDMYEIGIFGTRKAEIDDARIGASGTVWDDLSTVDFPFRFPTSIVERLPDIIEYILLRYDGLDRVDNLNMTSFVDMRDITARNDLLYSRQILDQVKTFDVINELVQQGIIAIFADSQGRRAIKSFLDDKTPTVAFDPTNIISSSLKMGKSPLSKVYTDFVLDYDYSVADGSFLRRLRVTKAEETSFPSIDDRVLINAGITSPTFSLLVQNLYVDFFEIRSPAKLTDLVPQTTVVTITGSSPFFNNIENALVLSNKAVPGIGYIAQVQANSIITSTEFPTAGGSIQVNQAQRTWQTFCEGFQDGEYENGREIWNQVRAGFQRTRKITPLPSSLSQAFWFHRTENSDDADNSMALKYLSLLKDWVTFAKDKPRFRIELNGNETLNIMDTVSFTDTVLTKDVVRIGWITNLVYDTENSEIEVTLTLDLDPLDPFIVIDTIDELQDVAIGEIPADDIDELQDVAGGGIPADDIDENF